MNDPQLIGKILREAKTIAVVGLSDDPSRPSNYVSEYMQQHGYRIIPVNGTIPAVLGEKSYASLKDIPEKIDLVTIFRAPQHVPPIVDDAIAIGAKYVWMQEGVGNPDAAAKAEAAGLGVVMDRCMMKEHRARPKL
jgi:uncharacterized protein